MLGELASTTYLEKAYKAGVNGTPVSVSLPMSALLQCLHGFGRPNRALKMPSWTSWLQGI